MNPPLLLTGAPGWLGTRLVHAYLLGLSDVPALAHAHSEARVRVLVHRALDPAAEALKALGPGVELCPGDLRDPDSLAAFVAGGEGATLIHAAGIIHPRFASEFYAINARGAENLVAAAEAAGVRRFVHVSSNSPIGTNPRPDHVFDESAPYNPYMGYGRSKMMAELAVKAAHARGRMETVIVRPPWFYGPGQPDRQTLFFQMIRQGRAPIVGGGENRRSMAFTDNLCQGVLLAAQVPQAAGQIYWIADRRPYSMNEIVDTIEAVLRDDFGLTVKGGRMRLPGIASEIAWFIDAGLQAVGLYHQKIHVLSEMNRTIACTIAKAEAELGYDPKVDLREGMRRSVKDLLDRGLTI